MKIAVINGPNLNMLGVRKKEIYGTESLQAINREIVERFPKTEFVFFQSNHEGALIDYIQTTDADGVVLNAGAYTHYSIAIRDAIESRHPLRVVEVHLSDVNNREDFRKVSVIRDVCVATYAGYGKESYMKGIAYLLEGKE
ncbi:MAG: 3-dehydroquinate dehydratase [Clostridia bacterium]|nr:3-dehydroquinate dehydratase [Clostridia bacterium]